MLGTARKRAGAAQRRLRLGIAVAVAGDEHDVERARASRAARRDRAAVAAERPAALGPGEEVAVVVGIGEREHDAQHGPAARRAGRSRPRCPGGRPGSRACRRWDRRARSARPRRPGAGRSPRRGSPSRGSAASRRPRIEPLRLGVRLRLVDRAARAVRAVEVGAQDVARRHRRGRSLLRALLRDPSPRILLSRAPWPPLPSGPGNGIIASRRTKSMPGRPYRLLILLALLLGVGIGLLVPRVRGQRSVLAPEKAVRAVVPRGDLAARREGDDRPVPQGVAVGRVHHEPRRAARLLQHGRDARSRRARAPGSSGTASGHVVTNFHVIQNAPGRARSRSRTTRRGRRGSSASRPSKDLAVLKIDAPPEQAAPLRDRHLERPAGRPEGASRSATRSGSTRR